MMQRLFRGSLAALIVLALPTGIYAHDAFDSGVGTSTVVDDAELSESRGRFIPARGSAVMSGDLLRVNPLSTVPTAAVSEVAGGVTPGVTGGIAGGVVTGVTVSLASTWERPDAKGVLGGYSAGASLTLDAGGHVSLNGGPWSSKIATGLGPVPETGTVTGDAFSGLTGIGQGIQVAGNGNSVVNVLRVDDGSPAVAALPTGVAPCGKNCTFTSGAGFGLAIDGPGGAVRQGIGLHGLLQTAQLTSDFNSVINTMNVNIGSSNAAASIAGPRIVPFTVVAPPLRF